MTKSKGAPAALANSAPFDSTCTSGNSRSESRNWSIRVRSATGERVMMVVQSPDNEWRDGIEYSPKSGNSLFSEFSKIQCYRVPGDQLDMLQSCHSPPCTYLTN